MTIAPLARRALILVIAAFTVAATVRLEPDELVEGLPR
jgi:hypothetical protein